MWCEIRENARVCDMFLARHAREQQHTAPRRAVVNTENPVPSRPRFPPGRDAPVAPMVTPPALQIHTRGIAIVPPSPPPPPPPPTPKTESSVADTLQEESVESYYSAGIGQDDVHVSWEQIQARVRRRLNVIGRTSEENRAIFNNGEQSEEHVSQSTVPYTSSEAGIQQAAVERQVTEPTVPNTPSTTSHVPEQVASSDGSADRDDGEPIASSSSAGDDQHGGLFNNLLVESLRDHFGISDDSSLPPPVVKGKQRMAISWDSSSIQERVSLTSQSVAPQSPAIQHPQPPLPAHCGGHQAQLFTARALNYFPHLVPPTTGGTLIRPLPPLPTTPSLTSFRHTAVPFPDETPWN